MSVDASNLWTYCCYGPTEVRVVEMVTDKLVCIHRLSASTVGVLKLFFNKTGNRFVETGYLPVIGLCDVMCHVAAELERKAASEVKQLRNHYVDDLREVTDRVQCNQTLSHLSNLGWLPPGAVASC